MRDRDYYDGNQLDDDEVKDLNDRGQPIVVKNRIFKKINFLLGTEVRNRSDPKALPRTPAHDDDTIAITDALRYVVDEQDFDRVGSIAWEHELIEGCGGCVIEHEIVGEAEDGAEDTREVEIRLCDIPWDRIWHDIYSRKADYSDASHKGTFHYWDLDDAVRFYEKRKDVTTNFESVLEEALTHSGGTDKGTEDRPQWADVENGRKRILVVTDYYLDADEWMTCHFTRAGFVVPPKPTGYLDEKSKNVCPLELTSGFVDRDGMRYGLVRHMIGPQDEINKRSSKALHLLSVRQTFAEQGAVLNPDEARTEMAKPDGWVELQHGALTEGRFKVSETSDMAQGQFALLGEAKSEIDSIGPEMPQVGSLPGSVSGRALMMRQQVGSLELARLEDNHKRWKRAVYRQIWYRIRQFWPEEKWLRVRDDAERTGFRFVGLNRKTTRAQRFMELAQRDVPMQQALASVMGSGPVGMRVLEQAMQAQQQLMQQAGPAAAQVPPEQQEQMVMKLLLQHPAMQEPMTIGDVANLDVDVILDESPDTSILQIEEYEQLSQQMPAFLQARPDMAGTLLEMLIEASQLRSKKKLLQMMRKPPDPQMVQMQQMMQQLQGAKAQADVAVSQSQAQLNQARAAEAGAKAETEGPKAMAEAQHDQALAMKHAADAGQKAGGGSGPL